MTSHIPHRRAIMSAELPPRTPHPADPYPPARRGKLITTVPVTEGHALRVQWPLPSLLPHWRESPEGFLGHLIGHEGEGSLFASLKEQGWLRSLSAGGMQVIAGSGAFTVSMALTDEGAPATPLSAAPLARSHLLSWSACQVLTLAPPLVLCSKMCTLHALLRSSRVECAAV